jgi:hypothetical protein
LVPLFLKRQCDRTLGTVQACEQAKALVTVASNDERAEVQRKKLQGWPKNCKFAEDFDANPY